MCLLYRVCRVRRVCLVCRVCRVCRVCLVCLVCLVCRMCSVCVAPELLCVRTANALAVDDGIGGSAKTQCRATRCKLCQAAYLPDDLPFHMTWKMIRETAARLVRRPSLLSLPT